MLISHGRNIKFNAMKKNIENIKTDFYKVFVAGNADNHQMLVVYLLLTVPSLIAFFSICNMGMFK